MDTKTGTTTAKRGKKATPYLPRIRPLMEPDEDIILAVPKCCFKDPEEVVRRGELFHVLFAH